MSAQSISHEDRNGLVVQKGDLVKVGTTRNGGDLIGEVRVVEGPIPGSRATREGHGTLYIALPGEWIVMEARRVEVVSAALA